MNRPTLFVIAGLCVIASPAHAILINLGSFPQPAGGDSPANELAFLNSTVIPAYNNTQPGTTNDLPSALAGSQNIEATGEQTAISVNLTDWEFVKFKWGPSWQFYYIAGETGLASFNSTQFNQNNQPQALSHYTFFNSTLLPLGPGDVPGVQVPDGGLTVAMLGCGLGVLALIRRRFYA